MEGHVLKPNALSKFGSKICGRKALLCSSYVSMTYEAVQALTNGLGTFIASECLLGYPLAFQENQNSFHQNSYSYKFKVDMVGAAQLELSDHRKETILMSTQIRSTFFKTQKVNQEPVPNQNRALIFSDSKESTTCAKINEENESTEKWI